MEFNIISSVGYEEYIHTLFSEIRTIAIIGLSPDFNKDSNIVGRYLQKFGFKIVPIYPKYDYILDEKVFRNILDIPFKIDIVNIFRKSKYIIPILDDCIRRNDINNIWLQLGIINNEVLLKSKENSINFIQDKCIKIEHIKYFKN